MKSLQDILIKLKITDLIMICKEYGIRGYSGLKKNGIVNLIIENYKNPQFREFFKNVLPDNTTIAYIYKSLMDNNNEAEIEKIKNLVMDQGRAYSTFRDNYRALISKYIIFEDEDTAILPKELNDLITDIVTSRLAENEEVISSEFEEKLDENEIKSIKTIDQLLYTKKYTLVSEIQDKLMKLKMRIGGNKKQLIERLLYESNLSVHQILHLLFSKVDLIEVCKDFGLTTGGTKEELIYRILEKFPPLEPFRIKVETPLPKVENVTEEAEGLASGVLEEEQVYVEEEFPIKSPPNIVESIFNFLNDEFQLQYNYVTDIKAMLANFNGQLSLYSRLTFPDLTIKEETMRLTSRTNAKIIKGVSKDMNLAVIPWYFQKKDDVHRISYLMMKTVGELELPQENIIVYIYDKTHELPDEDLVIFNEFAKVIRKTEQHFKNKEL